MHHEAVWLDNRRELPERVNPPVAHWADHRFLITAPCFDASMALNDATALALVACRDSTFPVPFCTITHSLPRFRM